MMAGQKTIIGELEFSGKGKAKDFFKAILNAGEVGRRVNDMEFEHLMDLLIRHPRADEKIGSGVESVSISCHSKYGNRFFKLHRIDGTEDDFSYPKCIDGDHNPITEFSYACRRAVEKRLHRWKTQQMDGNYLKCAITGESLTFSQAHVDHKSPLTFSVIAKSFMVANSIDLAKLEYNRIGIIGVEFSDKALAEKFDLFHTKMAILRIISAKENLKGSHSARVTPTKKDSVL
ncbi:MAG: DCL family protein [Verrucomicrobiales bacterium]|nr:DCL family protein [Verrucomicrobiales bacterium]